MLNAFYQQATPQILPNARNMFAAQESQRNAFSAPGAGYIQGADIQQGDPRRGMFPTDGPPAPAATGQFANVSPEAMSAWGRLTQRHPDLQVRSAYRSPEKNARVGGANHSQHINGNAFDVPVSNLSQDERRALISDAYDAGFKGVGVYNGSLHFDVGPQRAWGPDYHSGSIPGWAKSAIR
jgi:hypothetical protein